MSHFARDISITLSTLVFSTTIAFAQQTTTVVTPVDTVSGVGQQTTTTTVNSNGAVERQVIVTHSPAPQEVTEAPAGSTQCTNIAAGWDGNLWIPEHQVCSYKSSQLGTTWIGAHWACNTYTGDTCTNWQWKQAGWQK